LTFAFGSAPAAYAAPSNEGGYHPAVPTDLVAHTPFKGEDRKYLVHLPPQYDGRTATPLVVCLHGGGGDIGFAKRMFGMSQKADKENFIVAYPNGTGRMKNHILMWNAGECCGYAEAHRIDDVKFIREFVQQLEGDYNIDKRRVYLVGFSLGGMMSYRAACELSDQFSAVAVVSGSMNGHEKEPKNPVPMLIIHGLADKHVPVEGGPGKLAKWGFNVHAKPLEYSINYWVTHNGCQPTPKVEKQGIVERRTYPGGRDGSEVTVYTIDGYRHSWPGGRRAWPLADPPCPVMSATDACWDFFSRHERPVDEQGIAKNRDERDVRAAVASGAGS
jgi:polyhydroxybutyrate depolymerase